MVKPYLKAFLIWLYKLKEVKYMRRLDEKEAIFIKNNLDKLSVKQICSELKVSQKVFYRYLKENNLRKKYVLTDHTPKKRGNSKYRVWTNEELYFLKANYPKMETKKIMDKLNRTYYSIMSMVKKRGLYKDVN